MNRSHRTIIALILSAGCNHQSAVGNDGGGPGGVHDLSVPAPPSDLALGMPITAPMNTWTWVDFAGSECSDGSPTGIGVNPGDPQKLLVYLHGGGACWDYVTCFQLNLATAGPFGAGQFATLSSHLGFGTVFDRNEPANPFKDWSYVFVPYCTGDLHGGDNVASYSANGTTHSYHHKGHANMTQFVPRIAATWPGPDKVVVAGASSGGFGALFNYDLYRTWFAGGEVYLLDDSGPPLGAATMPSGGLATWYVSWNLGAALDGVCPGCRNDLSSVVAALTGKYPNDRFALLSSLQDRTMTSFFQTSPTGFQFTLLDLAATVIDPQPRFKYFFVNGQTHTMLPAPTQFRSQGVTLDAWLTQFLGDDPNWSSLNDANGSAVDAGATGDAAAVCTNADPTCGCPGQPCCMSAGAVYCSHNAPFVMICSDVDHKCAICGGKGQPCCGNVGDPINTFLCGPGTTCTQFSNNCPNAAGSPACYACM
jgi:hypothetical protein